MSKVSGTRKRFIFCLSLILFAVLTACGSQGGSSGTGISRAEFIGILGDSFGHDDYVSEDEIYPDVDSSNQFYPEIQACAEWDVIDISDSFKPKDRATVDFVLASTVRAIGTEDIKAAGGELNENDLAAYYIGNIAQIDISDRNAPVDEATAKQIVNYAISYRDNLELPQIINIEYTDDVRKDIAGVLLNDDGETGILPAGADYKVGEILYFDGGEEEMDFALKITSIDGNQFSFVPATLEETFAHMEISGTFDGSIVGYRSASDGTEVGYADDLHSELETYGLSSNSDFSVYDVAKGVSVDKGKDHIIFNANIDGKGENSSGSASFKVGIKNIKPTVTYEHDSWILDAKKVEARLRFDTEVYANAQGNYSKSIPLGEVDIKICGPFSMRVALEAKLGADGEITVDYTTVNTANIGWKKGAGLEKGFNSTPTATVDGHATLTAEATVLCDLRAGWKIKVLFIEKDLTTSLTNAEFTTGIVGVAKVDADLLGNQPSCIDVLVYVPLRWGVNQRGCLLTDISGKLKYKATVWDSESSPIQVHMHFEDLVRTPGDICTRTDKIVQKNVDETGAVLDEYKLFDFEPIDFDFIRIERFSMNLMQGETKAIEFASIPEGYAVEDLVYEVGDAHICSVSNGNVTGISAGSTIVKIKTKDGLFSVSLAVSVGENFNTGFQPL